MKPQVLDALLAAGATAEMIVAAVKAEDALAEQAQAERRRKNAERQKRYRLSHQVTSRNGDSANGHATNGDSSQQRRSPTPPKEITTSSSLRSDDGAEDAPDARTLLFRNGLPEVSAMTGKPQSKLRPLIGRWLQLADDDALRILSLISKAKQDRPADPIPWIEAHLRPKTGPPSNGAHSKPTSTAEAAFRVLENLKSDRPSNSNPSRDFGGEGTVEAGDYRRAS